jgi:hypothetical protein
MWLLSVALRKGTSVCATSTTGYRWTEVENYGSMGWAGLETGHLSSHEWSSHWASLGYVKLSEFVIQMALVTTV